MPRLAGKVCDLVVIDMELLVHDPVAQIRRLKTSPEAPSVVVLSDEPAEAYRAQLIAAGCEAILNPQLSIEKLGQAISAVLDARRKMATALLATRFEPAEPGIPDFAAQSLAMASFVKVLPRVARSNSSILILGETGVGKERVAHVLHGESNRRAGPFVAVHCGALPESLLESELFGHEEGAFTGATRSRRGCFELAHGGTIFLDEIGEMPLHLQAKLLRVLESHEIRRVGGESTVPVDVRVIAATNRELEAEVQAKQFRTDLYYRLNVVSLTVPPLRVRREDISALVESYINYLSPRIGSTVSDITKDALEAFCRYDWPGNVRELINVVERAMLLCEGHVITLADLPKSIAESPLGKGQVNLQPYGFDHTLMAKPLKEAHKELMEQFERIYLSALLNSENGRVGRVANKAGIDARTLFDKMKRYALTKEDFRSADSKHPA
jgi:DNA-binding NtrC family response regulator